MRYPYERFLRFLVSRKLDLASILERYGLPRVGDLWIADCRRHLRDTAPHAIAQFIDSTDDDLTFHDGVLEWADAEGFGALWRMQAAFGAAPAPPELDLAFRLFVNQHTRGVLGCLLLSKATDKEIQSLISDHFDLSISDEAISVYKRVFWDKSALGPKGWTDFVKRLDGDERSIVAFGLGAPTADEIRDMLGLQTVHSDEQIVNTIASKAFMQFRKAMEEPHPEAAGAMRWAELALKAVGVKKTAGLTVPKGDSGPTAADFHTLFSVKTEKSSHVSLAQLAGQVAVPTKKAQGEKKDL